MCIYDTGIYRIYEDRYKEGLVLQSKGPGSAFWGSFSVF